MLVDRRKFLTLSLGSAAALALGLTPKALLYDASPATPVDDRSDENAHSMALMPATDIPTQYRVLAARSNAVSGAKL